MTKKREHEIGDVQYIFLSQEHLHIIIFKCFTLFSLQIATMSSRFSCSDESSSSRSSSPINDIDFAKGILCNELKKFRSQICQTIQSHFLGCESLSALIHAFVSDYGYDPVARAKEFGYFSLYEFLASDYMKGPVLVNFKQNGDAFYMAVPGDESKHIFYEQRIWHFHEEKCRLIRMRRKSWKS